MTAPALLETLASWLRSDDNRIQHYLDWLEARFADLEPKLLAFLSEPDRFDRLRTDAQALLNQYPDPTQRPLLFGLPLGVKDIFHAAGFETHAGSQLPTEVLTGAEAHCISRLREAGALILGKTVTTEFAYFAPGPTRNPHNPAHTPGGSSSGSASAVAAGLAPFALGTQTIGSVNRPASFCGVVGYKPTFARIPTQGVIPLSPSLDHIGYFIPDAGSAAWLAPVIVDSWGPVNTTERPLRFAIPVGPYLDHADANALGQFELDHQKLQAAGHEVIELKVMEDFELIVERHNLILAFDAARVHQSWFGSFSEKYHSKTSQLLRRGETISQTAYQQALSEKDELQTSLLGTMDQHKIDAWVTPSAPGAAPQGLESTGDPVMNLPWTQSGFPTVTLPSGKTAEGLPLGLQVIAPPGQDESLLAWAVQIETLFEYESIHGLEDYLAEQH